MTNLGNHLYTFAVIADTHINQGEDISTSPFLSNSLSNARSRQVVAELNQIKPDFVIHLGDIINPVPHLPSYGEAVNCFHEIYRELNVPLHIVPGNHDSGDKPVGWMPAGCINNEYIAQYRQYFGKDYYSFDHGDLHIVIINAQLLNSGLADETEQKSWLEDDLAANVGNRIFLATHYPPFITKDDESGNYDNIEEPGRSWLLELCARHQVEAIFCGHVHNFFYNHYKGVDSWILPSTSFIRHDYSHLFHGPPGDEYGRNDMAKLGYFIVKIYDNAHVCHTVRSYGRCLAADKTYTPIANCIVPAHLREATCSPMGVELRHAWGGVVELPASGAIDEFERKFARNDYALMALWEMGAGPLRVPLHELRNMQVRERMKLLQRHGHRFTVYSPGIPDGAARISLIEASEWLAACEIIISWSERDELLPALKSLKQDLACKLVLSRMHGFTGESAPRHFSHCVSHGFLIYDFEELHAFISSPAQGVIDGCAFTVFRDEKPLEAIQAVDLWAAQLSCEAHVLIRLAGNSIADVHENDRDTANRVAEALLVAHASEQVTVFTDTFADIDRGHFVRNGLVDSRYNPRPAADAFRNLQSWLLNIGGSVQILSITDNAEGRCIDFICGTTRASLSLATDCDKLNGICLSAKGPFLIV
jgi:3',5'-cyclic AMP phosphodiesterase CpdA